LLVERPVEIFSSTPLAAPRRGGTPAGGGPRWRLIGPLGSPPSRVLSVSWAGGGRCSRCYELAQGRTGLGFLPTHATSAWLEPIDGWAPPLTGPSASAPRPARRQGARRRPGGNAISPGLSACGLNRPQRRRSGASRAPDLGATTKRLRPAADLRSVGAVAIERAVLLRLQGGAESR